MSPPPNEPVSTFRCYQLLVTMLLIVGLAPNAPILLPGIKDAPGVYSFKGTP